MSAHRAERPSRHTGHRAERRSGRRSGRTRALVALGAVAALATGLSAQGTFASWTDGATLQPGTFSSGSLDITLNDQLAGLANNGGTWTNTSFSLGTATQGTGPAIQPGEGTAISFSVRNVGSTPLVYSVVGTGSGDLATANGMRYSVTFGVNASTSGTAANGNRTGSCGGTVATDTNTTALPAGTPTTLSGATTRSLGPNASETVCIVARLSTAAPNGLQDKTGTASLLFDAKQPTAP